MRNEIVAAPTNGSAQTSRSTEYRMNTSTKVRVASLIAAALVTFGVIGQIADYAYPPTPVVQVAIASR